MGRYESYKDSGVEGDRSTQAWGIDDVYERGVRVSDILFMTPNEWDAGH